MATILGISGSPVPESNTDRAVKYVLEATGAETEFVKLSRLDIVPCRACLGCTENNQCVMTDDARELAKKFHAADGFVLGGFTPYSSLDARTKSFMERMYCLRHQQGLNRGKKGAVVLTSAMPQGVEGLPPAVDVASQQIAFWMMEEEMEYVGSVVLLGNVPCIRCGKGDDCAVSGIKMLYGPEATVQSVGVSDVDATKGLHEAARALGQKLAVAVTGAPAQDAPAAS